MGLRNLEAPKRTRTPKYQYSEDDLNGALEMLREGENPGDGPFDTPGQARAAANALLTSLENHEKGVTADIGSRVWSEGREGDDVRQHFFVLKAGRRKYSPRKTNGNDPAATTEPEPEPTEPPKRGRRRRNSSS